MKFLQTTKGLLITIAVVAIISIVISYNWNTITGKVGY